MNLHRRLTECTLLAVVFIAAPALAQLTTTTTAAAPQPAAPAVESELLTLVTKDGIPLAVTHYRSAAQKGTAAAKQITPVVLLHDYKDTRALFASLAARLQAAGLGATNQPAFDVITIDLRAHGDSTKQVAPNGAQQELDAAKLGPAGFQAMVALDMETIRSWLVTKNDEGVLNLNKLCLVGAGMGANIAATWAAQDWAAPPLATGKQGQDVKALVLISPRWTFRGLPLQAPLQSGALKQNVAWLLVYGADDPDVKADVRRAYDQLARFHPEQKVEGANGLISLGWPTKLQGSKLLSQVGPAVEDQVVKFLLTQVAQREYPWLNRRDRLP